MTKRRMNGKAEGSPLLTAVIPAKNLINNLDKVKAAISQPLSDQIKFVLVIDEPKSEARRVRNLLEGDDKFQKVKIISGEFNSPGSARNAGLKEVESKWVTFWDCDDEPNIREILNVIRIANDSQSEVSVTGFEIESVSTYTKVKSTPFTDKKVSNMRNISKNPGLWRMSFLTEVAKQSSFPALRMGEDQVFLSKLKFNSRRIYFSNSISYSYKVDQSTQLTSDKSNLTDLLVAFQVNAQNIKKMDGKQSQRFEMQLLSREFLTLIKNGLVLRPLLIVLTIFKPALQIKFLYEGFIQSFILIKRGDNKW